MSPGSRKAPKLRTLALHLGVMASYLAIALLHLRPLGATLTTAIQRGNREDALLHGWILNWTARQLSHDPLQLFDSNSFFPFPDSLAYTEHFIPQALPLAPFARWLDNPVLTYNLAFLFTFVAAGWGTFLLVRRITHDPVAAWVAGAFACWFPAKRWTLAHLNTISVHWVPFALLSLHGLLRRPTLPRALLSGIFVALAALSSAYYSFYFPLLLVPMVLLLIWADELALDARRVAGLGAAALVAAALVAPVFAQYVGTYPGASGDYEYRAWPASGVDAAELLILDSWAWSWSVPPESAKLAAAWFPGLVAGALAVLALWGPATGAPLPLTSGARRLRFVLWSAVALSLAIEVRLLLLDHRAWQIDAPWPATSKLPAALVLLGALIAVAALERGRFPAPLRQAWARARSAPRMAQVFAAGTLLAFLLAAGQQVQFFGHLGPMTPLSWLYETVPTLANLRAPYRVGYLGMALFAVLVGSGAARAVAVARDRWGMRPWVAGALLVVVMQLELIGPALPTTAPPAPRPVESWLAAQPGDFGIVELPQPERMFQTARGQWRSVYHWKRRVTGHNGTVPEPIERLHALASPVLGDEFLDRLVREFPVRFVVLDLEALSDERRAWALQERLPELRDRFETEERVGEVLVLRLLNGGTAGTLRRVFPRWMVAGTMYVELAEDALADTGVRRLQVRIGDVELDPVRVRGNRVLAIELPSMALGPLVEVLIRASPRDAPPLRIRRIQFAHPDGSRYP